MMLLMANMITVFVSLAALILAVECVMVPNVIVSQDFSGQFHTISDAINAAPANSRNRFVIRVTAGVYSEYVEIPKDKQNIMIMGDGSEVTIITGSRSNADGFETSSSATFTVRGSGFIGQDLSFVNTAGPQKVQAVAFYSDANWTVLYRCSILGYQDTLYAHSGRHFYKRCHIEGTVDFIFGRAAAVFQDCQIVARKGLPSQKNTITAQGRESSLEFSAFTLQFCDISVTQDVLDAGIQTYLGRPWKLYSTVVIMESRISTGISPRGWLEWNGTFALNTLYYGEYINLGPGADVRERVGWTGYHVITDPAVAFDFSVANLILGDMWLPLTGIEYVSGLRKPTLSGTISLRVVPLIWLVFVVVVVYILI